MDAGSCQMSQTSDFKSDNILHPLYILLTRIRVRFEIGRLRRPISKKNETMRVPRIHHLQGLWSDPCGARQLQGVTISMRDMAYAYVRHDLFTLLVVQARSHTNMHMCMREIPYGCKGKIGYECQGDRMHACRAPSPSACCAPSCMSCSTKEPLIIGLFCGK